MNAARCPWSVVSLVLATAFLGCCKATPPGPTERGGPSTQVPSHNEGDLRTREGGTDHERNRDAGQEREHGHGHGRGHWRGHGHGGEPETAPAEHEAGGSTPEGHLALGMPKRTAGADSASEVLVTKPQYVLSYNPKRNDPNWVAWQLSDAFLGSVQRFRGPFAPDMTLPEGVYRVRHDDYTGSGFDRGHMCPSDDRTKTPEDNQATFTTSNLLPQTHDNNAGPWERLESYSRSLVRRDGRTLYIVSGGIFGPSPKTIGHGVEVPDALYKVIVVLGPGQSARDVTAQTRVITVVMPNVTGILNEPWGRYRTSLEAVERASGYTFLTDVAPEAHAALGPKIDTGSIE